MTVFRLWERLPHTGWSRAYLVYGRGWSHEDWVDWTASTAAEQLFDRGSRSP